MAAAARALEINDALQLIRLAPERVADATRKADATIWVDLQDPEPAELDSWLKDLGIEGLARRLCMGARDRPGCYPLKREMFLVLAVTSEVRNERKVDFIAFVCRENLLLTVHAESALSQQRLEALADTQDWLPDRGVAGLVSALLVELSHDGLRHTAALRDAISSLEQRVDRDPDGVETGDITAMRAELLKLGAAVNDQLPVVGPLTRMDRPYFKLKDAEDYMSLTLANLQAAHGMLARLDERLDALHAALQMHGQDKMNRRLGALTILSAIFMPITLLAGIWGMNFESMPELKYPFSYPVALGLMVAIAVGMYRFFRRRGWFD